jgi:hypothetical protein
MVDGSFYQPIPEWCPLRKGPVLLALAADDPAATLTKLVEVETDE